MEWGLTRGLSSCPGSWTCALSARARGLFTGEMLTVGLPEAVSPSTASQFRECGAIIMSWQGSATHKGSDFYMLGLELRAYSFQPVSALL